LPALNVVLKFVRIPPVTVLEFVAAVIDPFVDLEVIDQVVGLPQLPDVTDVTVAASIDLLKNRVNRMIIRFLVDLIILVFIFYEF
jgi:hypothetical protein